MKIAFMSCGVPYSQGTGATYSSTKIAEELAERGHNVTVYYGNDNRGEDNGIEEREVPFNLRKIYNYRKKFCPRSVKLNKNLLGMVEEFGNYDVIYSYTMEAIPALEYISKKTKTPILVMLNAYGGICPKNTLLYKGKKCKDDNSLRCLKCIIESSIRSSENESGLSILKMLKDSLSILQSS